MNEQGEGSSCGFGVLLEDDAVLVVAKPAGIATQAPPEFDSLEARVRRYLSAGGDPREVYLGIPHRLDRPVAGVMVFAKTRRAARQLARQFERRSVRKTYWALVERAVEPLAGTWIDFLRKVYGQPKAEIVAATHAEAQEAILHYRTLGRHPAGSWLEIELETGRTHQIRVQAASRGHVVLGDEMYGSRIAFGPSALDERQREIALVARSIEFVHPTSKLPVFVEAQPGASWRAVDLVPREASG